MHKGRFWGVKSVKKILDRKIRYFGQKSKNSTKIWVIFNNFSGSHQLCDFCKNCFFGDLEHHWNDLDQNFFWEFKKIQNFWRISKNSHIFASKNTNNKFLRGDSHFILLYLLVSDFFINFEKKKFDSDHFEFFVLYPL